MKKIILSTLCAGVLAVPVMADVFDGNKEGFIVGIGAGYSLTDTHIGVSSKNNYFDENEANSGWATNFKIGYGFNNQFSVYYENDVSWFKLGGVNDRFITGISALAMDYYIDENSPWYVTGSVGRATFSNFTDNDTLAKGIGYSVGVGYEFMPNITVESKFLSTNFDEDNIDFDTKGFNITLNYTWY